MAGDCVCACRYSLSRLRGSKHLNDLSLLVLDSGLFCVASLAGCCLTLGKRWADSGEKQAPANCEDDSPTRAGVVEEFLFGARGVLTTSFPFVSICPLPQTRIYFYLGTCK